MPLSVRLDGADLADDFDDDLTAIEDEETPLGIKRSGLGGRVWWYWILIIISAISGKIAKDKRKVTEKNIDTEE